MGRNKNYFADIEEPKHIQTGATDTKILLLTITMVQHLFYYFLLINNKIEYKLILLRI